MEIIQLNKLNYFLFKMELIDEFYEFTFNKRPRTENYRFEEVNTFFIDERLKTIDIERYNILNRDNSADLGDSTNTNRNTLTSEDEFNLLNLNKEEEELKILKHKLIEEEKKLRHEERLDRYKTLRSYENEYISVKLENIPVFIKNSKVYRSFLEDNNMDNTNTSIKIPRNALYEHQKVNKFEHDELNDIIVNNIRDFISMICVDDYWELDEFPDSFIDYIYNLPENEKSYHMEELEFKFEHNYKKTIYYCMLEKSIFAACLDNRFLYIKSKLNLLLHYLFNTNKKLPEDYMDHIIINDKLSVLKYILELKQKGLELEIIFTQEMLELAIKNESVRMFIYITNNKECNKLKLSLKKVLLCCEYNKILYIILNSFSDNIQPSTDGLIRVKEQFVKRIVYRENFTCFEMLIKFKIFISLNDIKYIVSRGNVRILDYIITNRSFDIDNDFMNIAVGFDRLDMVKFLVEKNITLNSSLLHIACYYNSVNVLNYLLEIGIKSTMNLFKIALDNMNYDCIKLFIDNGYLENESLYYDDFIFDNYYLSNFSEILDYSDSSNRDNRNDTDDTDDRDDIDEANKKYITNIHKTMLLMYCYDRKLIDKTLFFKVRNLTTFTNEEKLYQQYMYEKIILENHHILNSNNKLLRLLIEYNIISEREEVKSLFLLNNGINSIKDILTSEFKNEHINNLKELKEQSSNRNNHDDEDDDNEDQSNYVNEDIHDYYNLIFKTYIPS